jgi:mono/diheme cytochrome c family protein
MSHLERQALCRALGVFAVIVTIAAGCSSARRGEPIVGPLTFNDPAIQRGRIGFERYCYRCHTQGEGGMGPIINDKPLPKFLMRFQVRHGLGVMPAFSPQVINDQELDDILNYIVALRHQR